MSIYTNENIIMDIIEDDLDLAWDWKGISSNPNLTIDFVTARVLGVCSA